MILFSYILRNKEWLFSGAGLIILSVVVVLIWYVLIFKDVSIDIQFNIKGSVKKENKK